MFNENHPHLVAESKYVQSEKLEDLEMHLTPAAGIFSYNEEFVFKIYENKYF